MKWGVLLVNSGTPASLATRDVRAFLAGLLGDPRVVELPRVLWWPILHGIILRIRPRASAKKYAAIWTPEGSPLAIESEALRRGLEAFLRPHDTPVALAMLYTGGASVPDAIASLRKAGAEGILTIPMFPQYCGASTGAVFDQVSAALRDLRSVPSLRFVSSYHDDAAYIEALAESVQDHRRSHGPTGHLLMSFHGGPERYVSLGDPYRNQCERTASLVAQRLGLSAGEWSVSFQSRFGLSGCRLWQLTQAPAMMMGVTSRTRRSKIEPETSYNRAFGSWRNFSSACRSKASKACGGRFLKG